MADTLQCKKCGAEMHLATDEQAAAYYELALGTPELEDVRENEDLFVCTECGNTFYID